MHVDFAEYVWDRLLLSKRDFLTSPFSKLDIRSENALDLEYQRDVFHGNYQSVEN